GQRQGAGRKVVVREPTPRGLGERRGERLAVTLVEDVGVGHKRLEVKGRALLVGKRSDVSAHRGSSFSKRLGSWNSYDASYWLIWPSLCLEEPSGWEVRILQLCQILVFGQPLTLNFQSFKKAQSLTM